jgi:hypothetical protein
VVAITGSWGSGKTSLVNLIKGHFTSKITPVDFNPWFFSGSDDLLERFFTEFATAMNPKMKGQKSVAETLKRYGQALRPFKELPLAGVYANLASSTLEGVGNSLSPSTGSPVHMKERLEEALRDQDRIFLVFIDDIDRLDPDEIRIIMKLVRLVGSLPKVIYLLAYDHSRVAHALSPDDLQEGQEYLEKIVFNSYQVPKVNESYIRDALLTGLDEIINELNLQLTDDSSRISGVIRQALLPSMKTLRNVKRFLSSCRPVCKELHNDVNFLDLVCMECMRIFSPMAFLRLSENSDGISWTVNDNQIFNTPRHDQSKEAVAAVLEADSSPWVRWILKNLFPFSWRHYDDRFSPESDPNKFLRDIRVGNRDVLTKYLARFDERGVVARRRVHELLGLFPGQEEINRFLRSLPLDQAADMADLLADMTQEIQDSLVIPIGITLLNLSNQEPIPQRRFGDSGVEEPARFFVARQLEQRSSHGRITTANEIYDGLESLESRYRLIRVLEMRDAEDERLLPEGELALFLSKFGEDFSTATPERLLTERWLLYLATQVIDRAGRDPLSLPNFLATPDLAWAFLRSSVSESINSRRGEYPLVMDVNAIDKVLGGRGATLQLINFCEENPTDRASDERILVGAKRSLEQAM